MSQIVEILALAAVFFLRAVQWMVLAHVVISWLALFGAYLYVRPLEAAMRVLYGWVRRVIPTTFGPFDIAPVVVLIAVQILTAVLLPFTA